MPNSNSLPHNEPGAHLGGGVLGCSPHQMEIKETQIL